MRRGEKEQFLSMRILGPDEQCLAALDNLFVHAENASSVLVVGDVGATAWRATHQHGRPSHAAAPCAGVRLRANTCVVRRVHRLCRQPHLQVTTDTPTATLSQPETKPGCVHTLSRLFHTITVTTTQLQMTRGVEQQLETRTILPEPFFGEAVCDAECRRRCQHGAA